MKKVLKSILALCIISAILCPSVFAGETQVYPGWLEEYAFDEEGIVAAVQRSADYYGVTYDERLEYLLSQAETLDATLGYELNSGTAVLVANRFIVVNLVPGYCGFYDKINFEETFPGIEAESWSYQNAASRYSLNGEYPNGYDSETYVTTIGITLKEGGVDTLADSLNRINALEWVSGAYMTRHTIGVQTAVKEHGGNLRALLIQLTEKAIDDIGEVEYTAECEERISAAETMYSKLAISEQYSLSNRSVFLEAKSTFASLSEQDAMSKERIKAAIDAIDAIGTVEYTAECKQRLIAADNYLLVLSQEELQQVENYMKYVEARALFNAMAPVGEDYLSDAIAKHCNVFMGAVADSSKARADLYFQIPNDADPDEFTVNVNGTVSTLDAQTSDANGYKFSISVPAKNMGDKIEYSLNYKGVAVKSGEISVAEYATNLAAYYPQYAEFVDAMLTYGAAAQTYFNYSVNDLVSNTDLTALAPVTGDRFDVAKIKSDMLGDTTVPIIYSAMNITCLADTTLSLAFRIKDGFTNDEALAWVYANVTIDGEAIDASISENSNGVKFVIIRKQNIAIADITKEMNLVVGEHSYSLSVMNYLVAVEVSGSDELKTLTRALYVYSQAAKTLIEGN